jgi:hypothetical protein
MVRQQRLEVQREARERLAVRFSSAFGQDDDAFGGLRRRDSAGTFAAAADAMQRELQAGFSDDDEDMGDDFGGGGDGGDDGDFDLDDAGHFHNDKNDGGAAASGVEARNAAYLNFDFHSHGDAGAAVDDILFTGGSSSSSSNGDQIVDGVDFGDERGSYEGLVKEIEERWFKAGKEFERTSRLAERVSAWEERLQPIFAEEETHPPFDIDRYGDNIMRRCVGWWVGGCACCGLVGWLVGTSVLRRGSAGRRVAV